MVYTLETFIPHTKIVVEDQDLPDAYEKLREAASATVTWNDGTEDVLLIAVGDDYSYITLQQDGTFYTLTISDDDEEDEVLLIGGVDTTITKNQIAPRELGLTVLQQAPDIPGLLTEYTWEEQ